MASENRLREVSNALMAILQDQVPDIPWIEEVQGLRIPQVLTGSFACTGISFKRDSKLESKCIAGYTMYIIRPEPENKDPKAVESLALRVRDVLAANSDLDQWATDSVVSNIMFATAKGREDVGIAVIEYEVYFDIEEG